MPTTDELQQQIDALTQRVNAITAPPTDYYVHQYSGEQIDQAVGNALNGRITIQTAAKSKGTTYKIGVNESGLVTATEVTST